MAVLSRRFSLDLMLTQLDDLSIMLFNLVNTLLLVFVIPVLGFQTFLFSAPAFYTQERFKVSLLLFSFFLGSLFSILVLLFSFIMFYFKYSTQLLDLNLGTSVKILVDLKKILLFFFALFKSIMFFFLPLNCGLVFYFTLFPENCPLIKCNLFFYIVFGLLNFFSVENIVQFVLLFLIQLFQLELFLLISFIVLNLFCKNLLRGVTGGRS
jgi:hypothetical protein